MDSLHLLRLALLVSSALYAIATEASPFGSFPVAARDGAAPFVLAAPRSYRHCHNLPRRVYCHKDEALPANWPPNTNTPGSQHFHRETQRASTIMSDCVHKERSKQAPRSLP